MPIVAVLDTCVLYPAVVRDTLLLAAEAGAFQLRWTEGILAELRRNLVKDRAAPEDRVEKMLKDLASAFADGRVTGYEHHIPTLRNDPKDRHVVAAAIEGGADLVVTQNLRDFAPDTMPPGVRAVSVDGFLTELLERRPAEMIGVLWTQATAKRRPPISVERVMAAIAKLAPAFAAAARPLLGIRTDEQSAEIAGRLERALSMPRSAMMKMEELRAALEDVFIVDPRKKEEFAKKVRSLGPTAVRVLADVARDPDDVYSPEAAEELRSREIDPGMVSRLSDDEILALLDRGAEVLQ